MSTVTWRAADELVQRVREIARREGKSMNEFLTLVLDAATDPELAGDEHTRVRERLRQAGLLAEEGSPRERPDPAAVAEARSAAGHGTPLSQLVTQARGEHVR